VLPTSCASAVSAAQVESALGVTKPIAPRPGSGFTTFDAGANQTAGLVTCDWSPANDDPEDDLMVDILPGSSWAWSSEPPAAATERLAAVTGVPNQLWGGCTADPLFQCSVYAQIDHSWLEVTTISLHATLAKTEQVMTGVLAAAT
jgi:hypothetical protein